MDDTSAVLHATSRQHHWRGAGLLSIKSFTGGSALYTIDGGSFLVDDERFLISNHAQEYEITIDSDTPVESFCVFFDSRLAADALRNQTTASVDLLDDPLSASVVPPLFFERTYPHDALLSPALVQFRASFRQRQGEIGWLDEQFHHLMLQLFAVHTNALQEVRRLPTTRPAAREELYRRLHIARDYIAASYPQPIHLNQIATVACLSPNHLLRSFKALFGQTPYQYLIDERMRRARWLLAHTARPITDICFAVGYESLGSFSWLFAQRCGLSPQAFRLLNRAAD
ncbi:MAG: AraC family transcriptional regulator [Chloroflexota bacterium]